jgi:hypothetical protein
MGEMGELGSTGANVGGKNTTNALGLLNCI